MQKFILATSDFAKGIQTDMNHYVTRDKINDAIFRQKLDSISKSILRRQNPVKLVFVGISTFDAKNPIIGSLLHELDVKEMVLSSDLFKGAPSTPGQNSEIQKRLDRLHNGAEPKSRRNINNNNNNNNSSNLSPPPSPPSLLPSPSSGAYIPSPLPFVPPPSGRFLEPFEQSELRNTFGNFHIPAQT